LSLRKQILVFSYASGIEKILLVLNLLILIIIAIAESKSSDLHCFYFLRLPKADCKNKLLTIVIFDSANKGLKPLVCSSYFYKLPNQKI